MTLKNHYCTLLSPRLYPIESTTVPYWIAVLAAFCLTSLSPAQDEKKKKKLPPLPQGVEVIRDIEYANVDGHSLTLDVYRPMDWAKISHHP